MSAEAQDRDDATAVPSPSTSVRSGDEKDSRMRHRGAEWANRSSREQWMPFRGMYHDVITRLPFYVSDWTTGFAPRNLYTVVNSTLFMYFFNLWPALAYTLDMNHRTDGSYGVNETIFASALALFVFSIFSCQPLTIVGVTGLINLVNYTNYDIAVKDHGVDYLQFQAWVLIWSAITHWIIAVFNLTDWARFFTDCTTTCFGLYVGIIYIQKGVELLVYEFAETPLASAWLSVSVAVLFALFNYHIERVGDMPFGPFWFRRLIKHHTFMLCIIFFTGFIHIPENMSEADARKLPIQKAFAPTLDRSWVVPFWSLSVKWIFVALPVGCLVTALFWLDGNVSSIMAQARHFPVKRPAGFHWDFFLLGVTTFLCGVFGLPAPNPLVPQAPYNTDSLCVRKVVDADVEDNEGIVEPHDLSTFAEKPVAHPYEREHKVVTTRLVEQRLSHFAICLLTVGTMTGPILHALGWMPRAMFAGIFIVVGWGSIEGNPIVHKTLFLMRDRRMVPLDHPLRAVSRKAIVKFLAVQWFILAATVAISQTIAAIGFPVIFLSLVWFRASVGPKIWTPAELRVLDAPTANSWPVMVSIGGSLERITGEGVPVALDTGIEGTGKESNEKPPLSKRKSEVESGLRRRASHRTD